MGVCVSPRGALVLTAFGDDTRPEGRQFHLPPGAHCPFCLVEEQVRDFLGPEDPLVHEYRAHLAHGSSRHLLIRRASPAERWTGRLRDRAHYRIPAPALRPSCPVHGPLLNAARQEDRLLVQEPEPEGGAAAVRTRGRSRAGRGVRRGAAS